MAFPLILLLSLAALWSAQPQAADHTPREQLARMSDSLRSLSYRGTVVYLHAHRLEALRVLHRVEDGQIREELISLNGPVRTLTREKGKVTCELANAHPISVPGHGPGKDMLYPWALDFGSLSEHYGVYALGAARVAGRQAEVIGVIPGDDLRYGYRFYLDQETGLPLKSDLMGQRPDPIEQIMFTSLELLPSVGSVADAASNPAPQLHQSQDLTLPPEALQWRFEALPPGFALVRYGNRPDDSGETVGHFVLSDGLASVSVYVESAAGQGLKGGAHIGAVHAAGNLVEGHQVTVVGEVPLKTVQTVLGGVRHLTEGQP